ncbi:MAG: GIY-YIG nuclease family protein [Patescibacteria group bacterium]|nr:GIY-YIG nuclease family protein [Patescibacteria group bacterium]
MQLSGFQDVTTLLRSGIYILVRRGVVIYVGKSKSLYSRIYTHKHFANRGAKGKPLPSWLPVKGIQFDEVHIRYCHIDDLDRLEAEMINLYKPHYNTNLKNALKARIPSTFSIGGVQLSAPPRPQIERRL